MMSDPKKKSKKARGKTAKKLARLEESIIALEEEKETLMGALATEAVYKDPDKTRDAQFRLAELEVELEEKNAQWEEWAS